MHDAYPVYKCSTSKQRPSKLTTSECTDMRDRILFPNRAVDVPSNLWNPAIYRAWIFQQDRPSAYQCLIQPMLLTCRQVIKSCVTFTPANIENTGDS